MSEECLRRSQEARYTLPIGSKKEQKMKFTLVSTQKRQSTVKRAKFSLSKSLNESKMQTQDLGKFSAQNRSFLLPQIKYFIISRPVSHSDILSRKILVDAQKKLKILNQKSGLSKVDIRSLEGLWDAIDDKISDSRLLNKQLEKCLKVEHQPSIKIMLLYTGIFICSITCLHHRAEELCQVLFNHIVEINILEYLLVFLLIKVRIKSKLLQWQQVLKILSKLLIFSWLYKERDLEIWCYFEFSKVYFSLDEIDLSEYYKKKSEGAFLEFQSNAYRLIAERNLADELELIRSKGRNISFNQIIIQCRLRQIPKQKHTWKQMISDQRKLQSSIKTLNQDCGVKHVKNMLSRLSLCNYYKHQKSSMQEVKPQELKLRFGSHIFRTHQSHIKNMNMFFRIRSQAESAHSNPFYTIESSVKNWAILKQMLKIIISEACYIENEKTTG